jgi:hypothetical protein
VDYARLSGACETGYNPLGHLGILAEDRVSNFVVLGVNPLHDVHNLRTVVLVVKHGISRARSAYRPVTIRDMASKTD